jgi:hypothetical protein
MKRQEQQGNIDAILLRLRVPSWWSVVMTKIA